MFKGSVFSFVLYCLLTISCAIFALSLKHQSMGINAPLSFLYIMIFFISLFKVEKIYGQDFDEAKIHQYLLSPFSLEIIVFVKNMMIYFNLIIFFYYILTTNFDYFKYRSNLFVKDKCPSSALTFKYYFHSFNDCIYNHL